MLKACAPRKAIAGRPWSVVTRLPSDVSRPIDTKAIAKRAVRTAVSGPRVSATVVSATSHEKTIDATRKPNTNFGNRSQITARFGRETASAPEALPDLRLSVHHTVRRKAATPISAFCDSL